MRESLINEIPYPWDGFQINLCTKDSIFFCLVGRGKIPNSNPLDALILLVGLNYSLIYHSKGYATKNPRSLITHTINHTCTHSLTIVPTVYRRGTSSHLSHVYTDPRKPSTLILFNPLQMRKANMIKLLNRFG